MPSGFADALVWAARHHPDAFAPEDREVLIECDDRRRQVDGRFGAGTVSALDELLDALRAKHQLGDELGEWLGSAILRLIEQAAELKAPTYDSEGWDCPHDFTPVIAWAQSSEPLPPKEPRRVGIREG